jgi:hypothetical protein
MANGTLIILIIPAILAFIFGVWVTINMIMDVSERNEQPWRIVGPDTIRMNVPST